MSHDEKMAFMRQFLEDTAGDMRLLDVVTDEEVQKLIDLYDAWEVVNDGLGVAHDANDALLNDKTKPLHKRQRRTLRQPNMLLMPLSPQWRTITMSC